MPTLVAKTAAEEKRAGRARVAAGTRLVEIAHSVKTLFVESAGFVGPNRQPPSEALEVASRRGIDMTGHRSRIVTQSMLDAAGAIVVMSVEQAHLIRRRVPRDVILLLGDLDPEAIERRTIFDPWGAEAAVFEASYQRSERCLGPLIGPIVAGHHGTTV